MLEEKFVSVLKKIQARASLVREPFALYASTNLAVQGLDFSPTDIDLATTKKGVIEFYKLLKNYFPDEPKEKEYPLGNNFCVSGKIDGIEVEIIGDFIAGNYFLDLNKAQLDWIKISDFVFPCLSLKEQLKMYIALGGNEKANAIKKYLRI